MSNTSKEVRSAPNVFLRESTGLVKEANALDILGLATLNIGIGIGAAWVFFWGPYYAPGGNIALGIILVALPMIFGALSWALLATIMPRSGGDYVFNSRILHPLLGFFSSFGWVVSQYIWLGLEAAWIANPYGSSFAYMMGWNSIGQFLNSGMGMFTVGLVIILLSVLLLLKGLKYLLRFQAVMFLFGVLMFLISWVIFASNSPKTFQLAWDAYSSKFGSASYQDILTLAQNAGISMTPSLMQAILIMPVVFWSLGYPYFGAYIAGETKNVRKSVLFGLVGAVVLTSLFYLLTDYFIERSVGHEFLASIAYVAGNGLSQYKIPVTPFFNFLAGILTQNPILKFLLGWGMVATVLVWAPYSLLGQTRVALAWSFDRLAPSFLGDVSERFHSPLKSLLFFALGGIIVLYIYSFYYPQMLVSFTAIIAVVATTFLFTSISAIIVPFRKNVKELYESSPVSYYKIGKLPFITLCGIVYLSLLLVVLYFYLTNPAYGALYYPSIELILGTYVAGAMLYFIVKYYRKKQGIELELAFKGLPPE